MAATMAAALAFAAAAGASALAVPEKCLGFGGFCASDANCMVIGRSGGFCGADGRCYETCYHTNKRPATEVPRSFGYCCDYGDEEPADFPTRLAYLLPGAATPSREPAPLPKHWGEPRFKNKRILVTGGDSGIGFAAVQAFYLECGKVMLAGHSRPKSEAAYKEILALPVPASCADAPPQVAWTAADISNATEVTGMVQAAVQALGGLDVAVNNAGYDGKNSKQIGEPGFIDSEGGLYNQAVFDVNIAGTLKCMDSEIGHWLSHNASGVIVNVASICGEISSCGVMYGTSKWAEIGFTKQAALHNAGRNIRINTLAPGAVNTTMLRNGKAYDDPEWLKKKAEYERVIPQHRIAEPWEMAGPITFLSSDMSSYVVGAVLTADGDFSQQRADGHDNAGAAALAAVEPMGPAAGKSSPFVV